MTTGPANLDAAVDRATSALLVAASHVAAMDAGPERSHQLRLMATLLLGQPEPLQQRVWTICPDVATALPIPDTDLCDEEMVAVAALSDAQVARVDEAIVRNTGPAWQTVARVIGHALVDLQDQAPVPPLGYFARRVRHLAAAGLLQSSGDLDFVRLSRIRRPGAAAQAA